MSYKNDEDYTGADVVKVGILSLITGLFLGFAVLGNIWATKEHNKCSETVTELMGVYQGDNRDEKVLGSNAYDVVFDCGNSSHGIC